MASVTAHASADIVSTLALSLCNELASFSNHILVAAQ